MDDEDGEDGVNDVPEPTPDEDLVWLDVPELVPDPRLTPPADPARGPKPH